MRSLLLCLAFLMVIKSFGQSKKQLKLIIDSLESNQVQLDSDLALISKEHRTLRVQYDRIKNALNYANRQLENKINQESELRDQINNTITQTISISPYLCLTQGFPINYRFDNESLNLFFKPVISEYQIEPDLVVNIWGRTSMLILGIMHSDSSSSCYSTYAQEVVGAAVILYEGKIWYTPLSNLKDSKKLEEILSEYRDVWLEERFGSDIAQKIANEQPWIGMTTYQLEAMFGWPDEKQSIQSVYGSSHIYTYIKRNYVNYIIDIENDKVSNIYKY